MTTKRIWIIGASSGIGKALAVTLAREGHDLILSARREAALKDLNATLGGKHTVLPFDVSESDQVQNAVQQVNNVDSVIFMSGAYEPGPIDQMNLDTLRNILDVNLTAPMTLVRHILPRFQGRGSGQIVLCASVAGYCGLPNGQPYSATKAGLINFAQSLRVEMSDQNIDIKMINPGFVKTPLTDKNDFDMPMITTPEIAAKVIARDLKTKKFEIHVPKRFTFLMKIIGALPYWLYLPLAKRLA